jgi:hypothetical protein
MSEQQPTRRAVPKKPYVTPAIRTFPATQTRVKTFLEQPKEGKRRQHDEPEDNADEDHEGSP